MRPRLDDVGELRASVAVAEVFEDVRLSWGDNEADLVGPAEDQPFDQVLGHGAWPIDAFVRAAANRKELLGKGQRLNAGAASGGRNDAPHINSPQVRPARQVPAAAGLAQAAQRTRARALQNCAGRVRAPALALPCVATRYHPFRARR